ncbi:hypothetical protein RA210_U110066 [Rubrivivax sp. A210]|uniref:DUF4089 domain-containing protein n=1 Tax=Rubrivivax sp. A210 TaxID=2772301 RepID=UPI001918C1C0|nr:DUF4089 domain-containing protein [Rubrivivax sp. A210]CAD5369777.1 hypothetical protein RA210_U110066 [Rubrivivax sp. A210]
MDGLDDDDGARHRARMQAACVDAQAALLGLPLAPEHRPGVLHYFGIAAAMAALVMEHPLEPGDEPAALFVPVSPEQR